MNYLISKILRLVFSTLLLLTVPFSTMAGTYDNDLQKLYIIYFGRPADPTGLAYWNSIIEAQISDGADRDSTIVSLSNSFAASPEYSKKMSTLTSEQQVSVIYENLFSHKPDPTGLVYWSLRLASGELTIGQISWVISDIAISTGSLDGEVFESKVAAAVLFTNNLNTASKILAYTGEAAVQLGQAFLAKIDGPKSFATETTEAALNATISSIVSVNQQNNNFQNNNGLNVSVNDNTTLAGASSTVTTFGNISSPAAAAIAYGDGGYPTYAENLSSHQTNSQGALVSFNLDGGMDSGSGVVQAISCSISDCKEPNVIRWGTWSSGTVVISTQNVTPTSSNLLHYIVGSATPTAALTGSATYAMVGQTTPTSTSGTPYSASIGNISVNFSNSSAALSSYALSGNNVNTSNYTFTNVPLTLSNSLDSKSLVITGSQTNGANNQISLNGFFAGATGKYIGAAIKVNDSNGTWAVNQVAAFKK